MHYKCGLYHVFPRINCGLNKLSFNITSSLRPFRLDVICHLHSLLAQLLLQLQVQPPSSLASAMKATTAPGYDDIPLSHAVGWLLAGVGYTAAYFIFMRSSYNFHKPCLPAFSLAINIAWEIALILISPVTPLASFVYVQWVVVDVALVHNQVKYGGLGLIEFLGSLVVGGLGEWCAMRTIIEVVVSAGATEEQARFQAAFWTGYGCQLVISSWSLVQVAKGQGAHLNYAGW